MKLFIKILFITFTCLLLVTQNTQAIKYTKLKFSHYVNMNTILPNYQKDTSAIDDNGLALFFINIFTDQVMTFTFSKRFHALNEKQLTNRMHEYIKQKLQKRFKEHKLKIIDMKTFDAHNQYIPYFRMHLYKDGVLESKAIFGIIRNYDRKHIIIYSFGPPSTFKEEEFIKFFSEIEFKTDNFV